MQQRLGWTRSKRPMALGVGERKLYWWIVARRGRGGNREGREPTMRRLVRLSDPGKLVLSHAAAPGICATCAI